MKTIIAGSRTITDRRDVAYAVLFCGFISEISEIISGCAKGVDQIGESFSFPLKVGVKKFPADWDKHGRSAGFIRNQEMVDYADALIAVWDGTSRGTRDVIIRAQKKGIRVSVYHTNETTTTEATR